MSCSHTLGSSASHLRDVSQQPVSNSKQASSRLALLGMRHERWQASRGSHRAARRQASHHQPRWHQHAGRCCVRQRCSQKTSGDVPTSAELQAYVQIQPRKVFQCTGSDTNGCRLWQRRSSVAAQHRCTHAAPVVSALVPEDLLRVAH
jgi:hypothetical protein